MKPNKEMEGTCETLASRLDKLSKYKITLIKRQDEESRRLGLNRESEDDFERIVEKPSIEECVNETIAYLNEQND